MIRFRVVDGAFRTSIRQRVNFVSPIYDASSHEIRISCARNETVGFFLVVQATGSSYTGLTVDANSSADDPSSLDEAAIRFYRVLSVQAPKPPGWHLKTIHAEDRLSEIPDLLIPSNAPIGGQPYELPKGQELLLWVDVAIPAATRPGKYVSSIRIQERGAVLAHIPLLATVLPFTLPDDPGVALIAPVDLQKLLGHHLELGGEPFAPDRILKHGPLYEEAVGLVRRTLLDLQRHRISPFLSGLYPVAKPDHRGELVVKWDDYDDLIAEFLDGRLYTGQPIVKYWPIPFDETFPPPPPYDPLSSPTYATTLRQYLSQCKAHFQERGWLDRAFLLLPPSKLEYTSKAFHTSRSYVDIARLVSDSFPLVSLLPPQDLRSYGWQDYPFTDLAGHIDVWCPPAQFFDQTVFSQPRHRESRKWMRLDRPPFSGTIDLAGGDTFVRVIPWQAARLNAEAVLLPTVNNWTANYNPGASLDQMGSRSPPLILPGSLCGMDTPLPTLRLKMLRRGMEDLAYLRLCEEKGLDQVRDLILGSLCRYAGADAYGAHFEAGKIGGWQKNPQWWERARSLMAEALQAPPPQSAAAQQERLNSIEWQRFVGGTQQVLLHTDGVRAELRPTTNPAALGGGVWFEVDFLLNLENLSHRKVSAKIQFGELPVGWSVESGPVFIDSLDPGETQSLRLRALARTIPAGDDGKMKVPIRIEVDDRDSVTEQIELSHITVRRLNRPIRLDGELSDWPLGIGNALGGFRSLIQQGTKEQESSDRHPSGGQVRGWVCADQKNLYFAFHCLTRQRHTQRDVQRNFLEYDDRIPIGEETLEILIDPTNGRSNSPADLFHIAIKPSGALVQERGIRCDPQVGIAKDWPAGVKVVTKTLDDRWIAEVRVPLESFGPTANLQHTWGVNFCRFDVAGWSYTTWSPTQSDAYLPISLGNMSFAK